MCLCRASSNAIWKYSKSCHRIYLFCSSNVEIHSTATKYFCGQTNAFGTSKIKRKKKEKLKIRVKMWNLILLRNNVCVCDCVDCGLTDWLVRSMVECRMLPTWIEKVKSVIFHFEYLCADKSKISMLIFLRRLMQLFRNKNRSKFILDEDDNVISNSCISSRFRLRLYFGVRFWLALDRRMVFFHSHSIEPNRWNRENVRKCANASNSFL